MNNNKYSAPLAATQSHFFNPIFMLTLGNKD